MYFASYVKLSVSLFLWCILYFGGTNQKNVLQTEIKDWTFEVYLLAGEHRSLFLLSAEWIIENDLCKILCRVLEFFLGSQPDILP